MAAATKHSCALGSTSQPSSALLLASKICPTLSSAQMLSALRSIRFNPSFARVSLARLRRALLSTMVSCVVASSHFGPHLARRQYTSPTHAPHPPPPPTHLQVLAYESLGRPEELADAIASARASILIEKWALVLDGSAGEGGSPTHNSPRGSAGAGASAAARAAKSLCDTCADSAGARAAWALAYAHAVSVAIAEDAASVASLFASVPVAADRASRAASVVARTCIRAMLGNRIEVVGAALGDGYSRATNTRGAGGEGGPMGNSGSGAVGPTPASWVSLAECAGGADGGVVVTFLGAFASVFRNAAAAIDDAAVAAGGADGAAAAAASLGSSRSELSRALSMPLLPLLSSLPTLESAAFERSRKDAGVVAATASGEDARAAALAALVTAASAGASSTSPSAPPGHTLVVVDDPLSAPVLPPRVISCARPSLALSIVGAPGAPAASVVLTGSVAGDGASASAACDAAAASLAHAGVFWTAAFERATAAGARATVPALVVRAAEALSNAGALVAAAASAAASEGTHAALVIAASRSAVETTGASALAPGRGGLVRGAAVAVSQAAESSSGGVASAGPSPNPAANWLDSDALPLDGAGASSAAGALTAPSPTASSAAARAVALAGDYVVAVFAVAAAAARTLNSTTAAAASVPSTSSIDDGEAAGATPRSAAEFRRFVATAAFGSGAGAVSTAANLRVLSAAAASRGARGVLNATPALLKALSLAPHISAAAHRALLDVLLAPVALHIRGAAAGAYALPKGAAAAAPAPASTPAPTPEDFYSLAPSPYALKVCEALLSATRTVAPSAHALVLAASHAHVLSDGVGGGGGGGAVSAARVCGAGGAGASGGGGGWSPSLALTTAAAARAACTAALGGLGDAELSAGYSAWGVAWRGDGGGGVGVGGTSGGAVPPALVSAANPLSPEALDVALAHEATPHEQSASARANEWGSGGGGEAAAADSAVSPIATATAAATLLLRGAARATVGLWLVELSRARVDAKGGAQVVADTAYAHASVLSALGIRAQEPLLARVARALAVGVSGVKGGAGDDDADDDAVGARPLPDAQDEAALCALIARARR